MTWSLSEFIGLIDVRGVCWGVVEIGSENGFQVRAHDAAIFYAVTEGRATLQTAPGCFTSLEAGDCAIVLSKAMHAIRAAQANSVTSIEFLEKDEYGDMPRFIAMSAHPSARLVCGRLKLRWPAGLDHQQMPRTLRVPSSENVVDFPGLVRKSRSFGSAAALTRAAALVLITALKDDPSVQQTFRDANFRDPIARAQQYMKLHPHRPWSVEGLASKVGMARSTFAARFLEEAGTPPMEALTEIRMNAALELLAKSDLKLAEIAERVGYSSLSAFSRRFENSFGMTPGRRRLQFRKKGQSPMESGAAGELECAGGTCGPLVKDDLDGRDITPDRPALSAWGTAGTMKQTWTPARHRH